MKRKNTMLTLDENTVESARFLGLNMSEISQNALQWEIKNYFVPIIPRLQSLRVRNLGIFKEAKITFNKGRNFITGPKGIVGKNYILWALRSPFTSYSEPMEIAGKKDWLIELELASKKIKHNFRKRKPIAPRKNLTRPLSVGEKQLSRLRWILNRAASEDAVILDNPVVHLDQELIAQFAKEIKKMRCQFIIITQSEELLKIPDSKIFFVEWNPKTKYATIKQIGYEDLKALRSAY